MYTRYQPGSSRKEKIKSEQNSSDDGERVHGQGKTKLRRSAPLPFTTMARVPLIGRLSPREYTALIFGFIFIAFEALLRLVIIFLPKPIINWFYDRSRSLFHHITGRNPHPKFKSKENKIRDRILHARDFEELCNIYGYKHEEHVCLTKDGYLLGLHRLPSKKGQQKTAPGTSTGNPVVYLHHGLLMNSEIWVCLTDAERALPFVLVEQGFDVWLGNNRYVLHTLLNLL